MPEDERESRMNAILERADEWAKRCEFFDKYSWLDVYRPEFKKILLHLPLEALDEQIWTDDAILSFLQGMKQKQATSTPPNPPPNPTGPIEFCEPIEFVESTPLAESEKLLNGLAKRRREEAETDLLKEIKEDIKDRRHRWI